MLCGGTRASRPTDGFAVNRIPLSFRALVEKSPTEKTRIIVHEHPEYSPAVAHRREIPRDRNGTPRTRASLFAAAHRASRQKRRPRWLTAEKSPAAETARRVPAPAHSPAGAPCRASQMSARVSRPTEETVRRVPAPAKCPRWLPAVLPQQFGAEGFDVRGKKIGFYGAVVKNDRAGSDVGGFFGVVGDENGGSRVLFPQIEEGVHNRIFKF